MQGRRYDIVRHEILATNLRAARKRAGLSATEAAQRMQESSVACTRATLLRWERIGGSRGSEPHASDLPVIAQVYECSISRLFQLPKKVI
jgi:transcriptional regulator with XRE-family HTH domain